MCDPGLKAAFEEVEDQEDEHLYHSTGRPGNCGSSLSACRLSFLRRRKETTKDGDWCRPGQAGSRTDV